MKKGYFVTIIDPKSGCSQGLISYEGFPWRAFIKMVFKEIRFKVRRIIGNAWT